MFRATVIMSSAIIFAVASIALGEPNYIGYSGAPGTYGTCAATCHGHSGGTIQISGFPDEYMPDQTYEITISHSGGSAIRQFNGSCRIGSGSENAGVITAGMYTATYNTSHETNGVRFTSSNRDIGTFNWAAPSELAGDVRLYIAGLQGGYSGSNSTIVLTSHEQTTGMGNETSIKPDNCFLFQNFPNPFNSSTKIEFALSESHFVKLAVYDLLGREITTLIDEERQAGFHSISLNDSGLSSGIYFYRLQAGDLVETKRMVLLK